MVGITIRSPVREDYKQLAELSGQLGYLSSAMEIAHRLEEIAGQRNHIVLVAVDTNGAAVGWIHGQIVHRIESDSFVEVGGMVVPKRSRSTGIGSHVAV